jgi:signal peptidase II
MASGSRPAWPPLRGFFTFVGVILALDIATKFLAESYLPRYRGVPIIGEFFQLRLVYNTGAAFGLNVGDLSRPVFMILAIVALVILGSMVRTTLPGDRLRLYALASICAGATGNLIDRVRSHRGVVDFLDFTVGAFHWPTFNVADMAVTCGAAALALSLWNEGKHAPGGAAAAASGQPGVAPPVES